MYRILHENLRGYKVHKVWLEEYSMHDDSDLVKREVYFEALKRVFAPNVGYDKDVVVAKCQQALQMVLPSDAKLFYSLSKVARFGFSMRVTLHVDVRNQYNKSVEYLEITVPVKKVV